MKSDLLLLGLDNDFIELEELFVKLVSDII